MQPLVPAARELGGRVGLSGLRGGARTRRRDDADEGGGHGSRDAREELDHQPGARHQPNRSSLYSALRGAWRVGAYASEAPARSLSWLFEGGTVSPEKMASCDLMRRHPRPLRKPQSTVSLTRSASFPARRRPLNRHAPCTARGRVNNARDSPSLKMAHSPIITVERTTAGAMYA
jgi:hypothetical protein